MFTLFCIVTTAIPIGYSTQCLYAPIGTWKDHGSESIFVRLLDGVCKHTYKANWSIAGNRIYECVNGDARWAWWTTVTNCQGVGTQFDYTDAGKCQSAPLTDAICKPPGSTSDGCSFDAELLNACGCEEGITIAAASTCPLPPTDAPTTSPTTYSPTHGPTLYPTTNDPTTLNPTTMQPTTNEPTTNEPTTFVPTTSVPTTMPTQRTKHNNATTTNEPTTNDPTTNEPTFSPTEFNSAQDGQGESQEKDSWNGNDNNNNNWIIYVAVFIFCCILLFIFVLLKKRKSRIEAQVRNYETNLDSISDVMDITDHEIVTEIDDDDDIIAVVNNTIDLDVIGDDEGQKEGAKNGSNIHVNSDANDNAILMDDEFIIDGDTDEDNYNHDTLK